MTESAESYMPPGPTEKHELLKPFEGTFRSAVKIWMGSGDSMESTGTMVNSWHLDGLYLNQDYVSDKVDGPFPGFCGKGYWGFNTTTQRYEGFWIDNAATSMQLETGTVSEDGKTWTMLSTFISPQTGKEASKRSVITLVDHDQHTMESFFMGDDGNEMKSMEISYTRS